MTTILRPLGSVERLYWMLDRAAGANFVMIAEIRRRVELAEVRSALDHVQARHPLLRVQCVAHGWRGLAFAPCAAPVELRVQDLGPDEGWLREAESDQGRRFELGSGPLARCSLLRSPGPRTVVLLTFHHSIADATSGAAILRQVVSACSSTQPPAVGGEPDDPIDALETRLPTWIPSARGLFTFLWRMVAMRARWLRTGVPRQVPAAPVAEEGQDRFLPFAFGEAETSAILAHCKSAGFSVNSALHAAQMASIAEEFAESPGTLGVLCLVDLRRRVTRPVEPEAMGLYFGFVATTHVVRREDALPALAARVQAALLHEISVSNHLLMVSWMARLAGLVPRRDAAARAMAANNLRLAGGLSVISNIGMVSAGEGSQDLEALHFLVPLCGGALLGSSAACFGGRLHWNFTYREPVVSRTLAERVAERARRRLLAELGME